MRANQFFKQKSKQSKHKKSHEKANIKNQFEDRQNRKSFKRASSISGRR
jgi:hypothetical protein